METLDNLVNNNILSPTGKNTSGHETFLRIKDNSPMVLIPAGEFIAGASVKDVQIVEEFVPWYKASLIECPQWNPFLSSYLMDIYTISNNQFSHFLNSLKCQPYHDPDMGNCLSARKKEGAIMCYDVNNYIENRNILDSRHKVGVTIENGEWISFGDTDDFPVTLVTWFGAKAYACWVNGNLPSELQWEKAARGVDGRLFPWGNTYYPNMANLADHWFGEAIQNQSEWDNLFYNSAKGDAWLKSRPVKNGSFPKSISPYGCEDLIGNVAEWCANWYEESAYQKYWSTKSDYLEEQPESEFRCIRGAGRYGYELISRISCRRRRAPHTISENLGFRCIMPINQQI